MFFGKKSNDKTVAIVDIESGSVGVALTRLRRGHEPVIFFEKRLFFTPPQKLHSGELLRDVLQGTEALLLSASEAATRLRTVGEQQHLTTMQQMGTIDSVAVFLSSPWSALEVGEDGHRASAPRTLTDSLRRQVYSIFGDISVTLHAFAGSAASVAGQSFSYAPCLLLVVSGESSEFFAVEEGKVGAYATLPHGRHSLLRTLAKHAGISLHEAASSLKLTHPHLHEPLRAAEHSFASLFRDTAPPVLQASTSRDLLVLSHDPYTEHYAHILAANKNVAEIFVEGGVVRALKPEHFTTPRPGSVASDLFFIIESAFVNNLTHR